MASLAALIVHYNSLEDTARCVASLVSLGVLAPRQIWVVDNASPDGSGAALAGALPAGVRCLHSAVNRGFGAGVNLGMDALIGDYVLVLNPDTYFLENRLAATLAHFERDAALGVLGLHLIYPDGRPQYAARRFYTGLDVLLRRTPLGRVRAFAPRVARHLMVAESGRDFFLADWVMGTGFVVRRRAFDAVGGMDEGYFLYFEDVDLCARLWQAGWKVGGTGTVRLVHTHRRESRKGVFSPAGRQHLKSLARFAGKFGLPLLRPPTPTLLSRERADSTGS